MTQTTTFKQMVLRTHEVACPKTASVKVVDAKFNQLVQEFHSIASELSSEDLQSEINELSELINTLSEPRSVQYFSFVQSIYQEVLDSRN
jgi:hypothetical protein